MRVFTMALGNRKYSNLMWHSVTIFSNCFKVILSQALDNFLTDMVWIFEGNSLELSFCAGPSSVLISPYRSSYLGFPGLTALSFQFRETGSAWVPLNCIVIWKLFQIISWGNCSSPLICFLPFDDHCFLLLNVQSLCWSLSDIII